MVRLAGAYRHGWGYDKMRRKIEKLLTDPDDVVHMKVSFDDLKSNPRKLAVWSSPRHLAPNTLKSSHSKMNRAQTQRPYTGVYKFDTDPASRAKAVQAVKRTRNLNNNRKRKLYKDTLAKGSKWLDESLGKVAQSLSIKPGQDSVVAGIGTGALLYGLAHNRSASKKQKAEINEVKQAYILKRAYKNQLGIEINNLTLLIEELDLCERKAVSTQTSIVDTLDQRLAIDGGRL